MECRQVKSAVEGGAVAPQVAGHTPGPWEVFARGGLWWPGIEAPGVHTSVVVWGNEHERYVGVQGRDRDEAYANARLIAAAPDLYRAAKGLLAIENKKWPSYVRQEFAALRKIVEKVECK